VTPPGGAALHPVWLGLGSNQGDRMAALARAVEGLGPAVRIDALSSVYETPPFGFANQPDFLNMVVRGRTPLAPGALLAAVKALEVRLGRVPTFRMGPRHIDIDILVHGDVVCSEPGLELPHPGIPSRPFVLVPLLELDPDAVNPADGLPWARYIDPAAAATVRRLGHGLPLLTAEDDGSDA
jgi:2-amino-4-hydroxy-6-hydroxymethyldihydropteridine diphosphokinase